MNHDIDFTTPQRLHFFGVIIDFFKFIVKAVKAFGLFILFIMNSNTNILHNRIFWILLMCIPILFLLYSYLNYRNFIYLIDPQNGEFIVQKGIFSKERIILKFEKIIQININQNVIQQALDLYSVEIESSGSSETEIELYALNEKTANELKNYLLLLKGNSTAEELVDEEMTSTTQEVLFGIKAKDTLLVSLFSNYRQGMLIFLAFLVTFFNQFADFISNDIFDDYLDYFNFSILLSYVIVMITLIMIVPIVINLARYFITYYNFKLSRNSSGVLNIQYGLFNLKDLIFNRNKVQVVIITSNWILKKLKLNIITLQQVLTDPQKQESSFIHLPGATDQNKKILFEILYDKKFGKAQIHTPSISLFITKSIKALALILLVSIIGYHVSPEYRDELKFAAIGLYFLTLLYNFLYYKNMKLVQYEDFLVKKAGVWDIKETIVPYEKINAIAIGQTVWQIRKDLGYLELSTSSGLIKFNFFKMSIVNDIANLALYNVEKQS